MTTTLKDKNHLVVPPSIQRRAGFKVGDQLEFKVSGSIITIIPKLPSKGDEYTPAQRRVIDVRLAKSEADIEHGRVYGPFDSAQEMGASLEANIKKLRAAKRKVTRKR